MTVSNSTIQRARQSGNPVIHGNRATFIWEGKYAPYLMSDLNGWDETSKPFKRISPRLTPASDKTVWSCSLTLPLDAYLEYAFYDPKTQTRFLDPLNRRTVNNGFGGRNNFFYMPETMPSPFSIRRANVPVGALTRHRVDAWMLQEDSEREIYLYRPPVKEPVPILIVYDGIDYLQKGKLAVIVDNLIADKRIRPIAMAFLQNGKRRRAVEYACSDATLSWVEQVILPLAKRRLNLMDIEKHPGAYGVLGASFGGLMSMYTGLRMPEIFGNVLSQSGVFGFDGRDFAAVDLIRHGQGRSIKIWMDAGKLEWLLKDNRRMQPILKENGYQVIYREYSGGHNYTSWRDDLWRGLEVMFPFVSR
ncbi:MAG TPA: alpha/beta hydrolase-fold protein [Anaerolineales bacterium]|nr:alpha/beta hydrolase-fold protein [Anaerolineales bacterium]